MRQLLTFGVPLSSDYFLSFAIGLRVFFCRIILLKTSEFRKTVWQLFIMIKWLIKNIQLYTN